MSEGTSWTSGRARAWDSECLEDMLENAWMPLLAMGSSLNGGPPRYLYPHGLKPSTSQASTA